MALVEAREEHHDMSDPKRKIITMNFDDLVSDALARQFWGGSFGKATNVRQTSDIDWFVADADAKSWLAVVAKPIPASSIAFTARLEAASKRVARINALCAPFATMIGYIIGAITGLYVVYQHIKHFFGK